MMAPARTLSAAEVAGELGKSVDWIYRNWSKLASEQGFPPPLLRGGELTWSRLHFHCWQDRELPAELRRHVTAVRLAEAALASPARTGDLAAERLRQRYASTGAR
jgi:predicted DNA-binding transcriptional regulator AlpA